MVELLTSFSKNTGIYSFMNSPWGWPTAESIHFLGLCLLIGCVGVFDLRMLGIGRGISYVQMHKLVKVGVFGYILNVTTGIMFLTTAPDQYLFNPAFQSKLLFMLVAGLNMLWFYAHHSVSVKMTDSIASVTYRVKVIAMISLLCWMGVVICGRLITYFRPPYHWCWFC